MQFYLHFLLTAVLEIVIAFLVFFINAVKTADPDSLSNGDSPNGTTIAVIFQNKYRLTLTNEKVISHPYPVTASLLGTSVNEILVNYHFTFYNFYSLDKRLLTRKVLTSITVVLLPKEQFIKWHSWKLITEKLLEQLNFPRVIIPNLLKILHSNFLITFQIKSNLQNYLGRSYKKYYNILLLFMVT